MWVNLLSTYTVLTRAVLCLCFLAKEAVKFHQDFRTYGDDYKHWPPVVETAKVLWTQYFADIEKRVLFPTVRRRQIHMYT
jgi:hypothetical protein